MPVEVKICGVNDEAAVAAAVEGGARWVGFVFYPASPRFVDAERAAALAAAVPAGVLRVGLVVDADDTTLDAVVGRVPLDLLQLHGRETPERAAAIRARHGLPIVKAIPLADEDDVAAAAAWEDVADRLLFDARPPPGSDRPGGNAVAFDWRLPALRTWRRPWLLAGGLTADTLADAVRLSGAAAVDVSSGVETAPGRKSSRRIRAFLAAAAALSPAG